MTWLITGGYTQTSHEMTRMRRLFLERTANERWRRYMLMVLDAAIDRCERRNLAAPDGTRASDLQAPQLVVDLIQQLQVEQGLEIRPPYSNQHALDMLFELQRAYMPSSHDEDETAEAAG